MDVTCSKSDFGFLIERSFFGSNHGKGPCDGVGGMVKAATRRGVLGRQVWCKIACPDTLIVPLKVTTVRDLLNTF